MHKGLRITFSIANAPDHFLKNCLQSKAKQLKLEGIAQIARGDKTVKVCVYGHKENVDDFVDFLHKETATIDADGLKVEPFPKDRDYRGSFRVVD